jgi:hypothetical protein
MEVNWLQAREVGCDEFLINRAHGNSGHLEFADGDEFIQARFPMISREITIMGNARRIGIPTSGFRSGSAAHCEPNRKLPVWEARFLLMAHTVQSETLIREHESEKSHP